MRKNFILPVVCAIFCACSNYYGPQQTVHYPVDTDWHSLSVSGAFEVRHDSDATVVTVTIGEKAVPHVRVEVNNGTLYIDTDLRNMRDKAEVLIPLTFNLEKIDIGGASSFSGFINADNSQITLSGASSAFVTGDCSGVMTMNVSGSSSLNGQMFTCNRIQGTLVGASFANVTCCESLKVDVNGASKLYYGASHDGCRPDIDCNVSGAGKLVPR